MQKRIALQMEKADVEYKQLPQESTVVVAQTNLHDREMFDLVVVANLSLKIITEFISSFNVEAFQ